MTTSRLPFLASLLLLLGLAACGGPGPSSSSGGSATAGDECDDASCPCHAGEGAGSGSAEIDALHAQLGPVFHMEAGAARAAAACEHAGAFRDGAGSVQAAPAPAGADAGRWSEAGAALVAAADGLRSECDATGPAVEERLSTFHAAFHGAMELAGGHGGGCEHCQHAH